MTMLTEPSQKIKGLPTRIRIQEVIRGQRQIITRLYCGRTSELVLDTDRIKWPQNKGFFQYSTKLGRKILASKHSPIQLVRSKWQGTIPDNFHFS